MAEVKIEDLTDAQLMELANKELAEMNGEPAAKEEAAPAGEEAEQEAAGEQEQQEEEQEQAEPEKWFVREIDLGDGSGKQVFKGRSLDELADRLAEAQANATRKIRELSQAKKQEEKETADNEFVLSQELLNKPSATLRRQFEEMVGMPIDSFKSKLQKVEAFEKAQSAEEASKEFVQTHEDYYASPGNGKRLSAYLTRMGLDWTVENMEKAFKELSADGLLAPRPESEVPAEHKAEQETTRIAEPVRTPIVQKRVAGSGLSSKRSVAAPKPKATAPSEDDLYNMPLEKLRELANKETQRNQDPGLAY